MGVNDPHRFVRREREQDYWCSRCGTTISELKVMDMDSYRQRDLFHYTQCWTAEEKKHEETDQARFVSWLGG